MFKTNPGIKIHKISFPFRFHYPTKVTSMEFTPELIKAKIAELQHKSPAYENDKIYISVACCNAMEAIDDLVKKVEGGE